MGAGGGGMVYRPGIDGVRALAVVAVVLYHADVTWLPGGFLGVDVFFVVSGYLICSLLVAEHARTGRLSLRDFWVRRARRLLPALAALLVAAGAFTAVVVPDAAHRLWADAAGVVLYVPNWWQLIHHQSYVESFGRPSPLQHLWSLGVEEQFYLAFPLLLALVLPRWSGRTERLAPFAAAAAAGSAVLMAVLWHPGADPSRVWFGTDTRAMGLCVGVALGFALPPDRLPARINGRRAVTLLDAAGITALYALVLLATQLDEFTPALYRGGFAACAVASGVLVVAAAHPGPFLAWALARRPLRWLGTRSYAIYLWHWPVVVMTRPGLDLPWHGSPVLALRLGLTAVLAELSWHLVERPWRTGRVRAWWSARRPITRTRWALGTTAFSATLVAALAAAPGAAPAATLAAALASPTTATTTVGPSLVTTTTSTSTTTTLPVTTLTTSPAASPTTVLVSSLVSSTDPEPAATSPAPPPPAPVPDGPVLALGDSVMVASARALTAAGHGHIVVDAAVGRQTWEGIDLLERYRDQGRLASVDAVIWGLGTNGPLSEAQVDRIADLTTGVPRVVLVTVRVPKRWQTETNASIAHGVPRHGRLRAADWHTASAADGMISDDGVHPTPAGARLYAQVVLQQLDGPDAQPPPTTTTTSAPPPPPTTTTTTTAAPAPPGTTGGPPSSVASAAS